MSLRTGSQASPQSAEFWGAKRRKLHRTVPNICWFRFSWQTQMRYLNCCPNLWFLRTWRRGRWRQWLVVFLHLWAHVWVFDINIINRDYASLEVFVVHDFSRHCFMCVTSWRPQWCRQSDQKSFTSEGSASHGFGPCSSKRYVASDAKRRLFESRPSLSCVRARWSRSAGWTALWSSGEAEPSFRCRSGWPTWRAACSPAPRSAWGINSSTSSSARPGPFFIHKCEFSVCDVENLSIRNMFVRTYLTVEETIEDSHD